ncbi:MAG: fibronectin type III domain-containing protein [Muribaculaceae bacterium]
MTTKRLNILMAAVAMLMAVACNSYDDPYEPASGLPAVATPEITCTANTYCSLSFSWNKVADAVQYSYQLSNSLGVDIAADVTSSTTATFDGLQSGTLYTLRVVAYPAVLASAAPSNAAEISVTTSLIDVVGTYESLILGSRWSAQLVETSYNTFVLKGWYGADGYDLHFTVNSNDGTITINNGELDSATGRMLVATGSSKVMVKKGALIDGKQSYFNREENTLSINVRATNGTREKDDLFTW